MRKAGSVLMAALLALPLAWAQAQKPTDDGWPELLPPGEGRELVLTSCASCHNLKSTVHERKSRAEWAKTVNDMILRGAPIFPEEIEPITAYVSRAFGSTVPKLLNVNTATGEELEKLPNLKPEAVARLLELRRKAGPFKNAQELRQALGNEGDEFEKIRYFLKYKN